MKITKIPKKKKNKKKKQQQENSKERGSDKRKGVVRGKWARVLEEERRLILLLATGRQ